MINPPGSNPWKLTARKPPSTRKQKSSTPHSTVRSPKQPPKSPSPPSVPPDNRTSPPTSPTNRPPNSPTYSYVQIARNALPYSPSLEPTPRFPAASSSDSTDISDDATVTTRGSMCLPPAPRQTATPTLTVKIIFQTEAKLSTTTVALRSSHIMNAIIKVPSPMSTKSTILDKHGQELPLFK